MWSLPKTRNPILRRIRTYECDFREMTVVSKPKWQILDATTLKFLAVILMVLDHIHEMFVSMEAPM